MIITVTALIGYIDNAYRATPTASSVRFHLHLAYLTLGISTPRLLNGVSSAKPMMSARFSPAVGLCACKSGAAL